MWGDGRAHDGGAVWHHGGVDGGSGKINVLINLGDGFEEDDDSDFCGMCVGMRLESA
jgi:hypothetical protein